jgi:ADP-heptose:LPS heptosyltransferase
MDRIGDFLLWIDAAIAIRGHYKSIGSHYDLAVNEDWGDLARQMDLADGYHFINVKRFRRDLFYRYRVLRQVRRRGYSLVLHPTYSRTREVADAVVRATGAPERIGYMGEQNNFFVGEKDQADDFYTHLINNDGVPLWDYQKNTYFNAAVGIPETPSQAKETITRIINPVRFSGITAALMAQGYFVIAPGSSWIGRRWPLDRFADIARRTQVNTGWQCVLCGGGDETKLVSDLQSVFGGVRVLNLIGRTSLAELAWILAHAQFVVGNESATVQLSALLGVKTVAIAGGGHFGRFLPYDSMRSPIGAELSVAYVLLECFGCNWDCIYPRARNAPVFCVERVEAQEVWKRVCSFLVNSEVISC